VEGLRRYAVLPSPANEAILAHIGLEYEAHPHAIVFRGSPDRHLGRLADAILSLGYAHDPAQAHRYAASFFLNPRSPQGDEEEERLTAWLRAHLEKKPQLIPAALCTCLKLLPELPEDAQRAVIECLRPVHEVLDQAADCLADQGLSLEMRYDSHRGYLIALARPFEELEEP